MQTRSSVVGREYNLVVARISAVRVFAYRPLAPFCQHFSFSSRLMRSPNALARIVLLVFVARALAADPQLAQHWLALKHWQ